MSQWQSSIDSNLNLKMPIKFPLFWSTQHGEWGQGQDMLKCAGLASGQKLWLLYSPPGLPQVFQLSMSHCDFFSEWQTILKKMGSVKDTPSLGIMMFAACHYTNFG